MDQPDGTKAPKPSSSSVRQVVGGLARSKNGLQQTQVVQSAATTSADAPKGETVGSDSTQESQPPPQASSSVATTTITYIPPIYNLIRFTDAQNTRAPGRRIAFFEQAYVELRRGCKTSHWIWFIFPQLADIKPNPSPRTRFFGLRSAAEARAYLAHEDLGRRLRILMRVVLESQVASIRQLMGGEVDAEKLRSCVTLFVEVAPEEEVFGRVLEKWFDGDEDEDTLNVLARLNGTEGGPEATH